MLEIYRELVELIPQGKKAVLATVIESHGSAPRKAGAKMLIKADGTFTGTVGGGGVEQATLQIAAEVMQSGQPQILHFDLSGRDAGTDMICGGQIDIFLEPILPKETLYLCGAGHISQSTAHIARTLGFRVVIIDPRADYNNRERFPDADELLVEEYAAAFTHAHIDDKAYIVIYTPGHASDAQCLQLALATPAYYVGMIGSKKKVKEVKERLLGQGVPQAKLDSVHAPIGIDINAETPDEIAVSILAEIIQVRRHAG